jgi:hypothetical protein
MTATVAMPVAMPVILILIGVIIAVAAFAPRHVPWPSEVVYSEEDDPK